MERGYATRYCVDEMKYHIEIAIKTIAGMRLASRIRRIAEPKPSHCFFSSFFAFGAGSGRRLMVFLFDIVILSFQNITGWHNAI